MTEFFKVAFPLDGLQFWKLEHCSWMENFEWLYLDELCFQKMGRSCRNLAAFILAYWYPFWAFSVCECYPAYHL